MRSCAIQLSAREEHSKRLKVATFGVGEWHGLAECERVRVHDMHTFGRGLRAIGVSFEDRQDLPGAQELADQLHSGRNGLLPICSVRSACGGVPAGRNALFRQCPLFSCPHVFGQDVTKYGVKHLTVLAEDQKVRVLRYAPSKGDKTPMHSHPSAVVYVIQRGRVKYTMPDGSTKVAELKAGEPLLRRQSPTQMKLWMMLRQSW